MEFAEQIVRGFCGFVGLSSIGSEAVPQESEATSSEVWV